MGWIERLVAGQGMRIVFQQPSEVALDQCLGNPIVTLCQKG
jgi:hypothetical protein